MAGSGGKINVRAFAEKFEQQGVIKNVGADKKEAKEQDSNKSSSQPHEAKRTVTIKPGANTGAPPKVAFGRDTLNKQLTLLKGRTPESGEEKAVDKPKTMSSEKPMIIPRGNKPPPKITPKPFTAPKPAKNVPSSQDTKTGKALPSEPPVTTNGVAENSVTSTKENKENNAAVETVKPVDGAVLEGLLAKNRLLKAGKRKSYQKPKENPVPPEGLLGRAPTKPARPPVILEVKRDLRAPLPPPPEFAILVEEQEEYADVEVDVGQGTGRPISIIQPMTEDEELGDLGEVYDDVEAATSPSVTPRKQDPLPPPPPAVAALQASARTVSPIPTEEEEGEIYDDVSEGENQEEGEMEDIYETFDDMPAKGMTRSGSQETLSSTASKDKEDKEAEKQRQKKEKERKKQEEKEKKEREKKEKEEKRLKELKEKEEKKHKKEEEKRIRKLFNIKGDETPVLQGRAIRTYGAHDNSNHLPYLKGQLLYVIRLEGNPEGKWLAKNEEGKYGYVETGDIDAGSDETYDEAETGTAGDDGIMEETYECVDTLK
ncbi:FYN-binding protein 1-like isoform X2 [Ptychodera flava]|uniref:FYN-binding protein 1-like isoform X2 n=1 Tax=Ptychodera flava TaxID=63121 RepID=UPI003969E5F7